ncbi:MAG: bifunctional riboflavin kinase/FAD synthetase [Bacteroidales bacterium]|nr:bifunctional riboflavin kinase/FAD synthetase [Bacteroidales bacterium]
MKIFRDLENITITSPVVTIGIFDGVHRAHRAVIHMLREKADSLNGESTIVTLWPHPRYVLNKDAEGLQLLNTLEEKIRHLERAGVDNLVIIPFSVEFARTEFSSFVRDILIGKIGLSHLVVGYNHQFGRNRDGNFGNLKALSAELGFGLSEQEPILIDGERVSSTSIRGLLSRGEVKKAAHFMGYTYKLHGKVVGGYQKGREIGFPTANISMSDTYKLIPHNGVYAVMARTGGREFEAMMNIGCRPTLYNDSSQLVLEAHLLEYSGDLYDEEIEVEFIERVRDEKKFESMDHLKKQIEKDRILIKEILSSIK